MTALSDGAAETRAQGWRALAALHARIEGEIERALQAAHGLSVSEYAVLDVLSRQDEWHMRMQQLADAVVLSQSATTRLVTRLEADGLLARHLCATDRRGIYTELTEAGRGRLAEARPTHDAALSRALAAAGDVPELAPLVRALADATAAGLPAAGAPAVPGAR
ncbi:MarR family transcriptional regulator [Streptacidiphilus sp. PB12-B1b]|uniref:MarR family winged helix-turn-helix transcriptional regulator n=1 Tax=Streptacidiphilus sp. PB12-B1b TaxID=2705012 RepID=UPI0015FD875C|nr:MarR family transcriptional regulator [Streptacidiphilus sp. PB12-B1b]QMU76545.1 MarR family transcriptional regulator [Streptacidiphilus sp. PB12-B1b]